MEITRLRDILVNSRKDIQASSPLDIMANSQVAMLHHHQHQALHRMLNECLALLILIVRAKLQRKNYKRLYKTAKARIFQTNVVKYLFVSVINKWKLWKMPNILKISFFSNVRHPKNWICGRTPICKII